MLPRTGRAARRCGLHRPQRRASTGRFIERAARKAGVESATGQPPVHAALVAPARSRPRLSHRLGDVCERYGIVNRAAPRRRARRTCHGRDAPPPARGPRRGRRRTISNRSTTPVASQHGRRGAGRSGADRFGRLDQLGIGSEPHQRAHEPLLARHRKPNRDPAIRIGLADVVDRVALDHPASTRRQPERGAPHRTVGEPVPWSGQRPVSGADHDAGRFGRLDAIDAERPQLAGAIVVGAHVPLATVGEDLTRHDQSLGDLVTRRAPVFDPELGSRGNGIGHHVGERRAVEVDPHTGRVVLPERRSELREPPPERAAWIGTRQLHRRAAGGEQLPRLDRVEPERAGEQPRHTDPDHSLVDEDVDQLVDERRQAAHRRPARGPWRPPPR